MGLYLSPWDRHEPKYGTAEYNDYYKMQLTELMTQYGEISEVWFDGAKGEGAKDMEYDFDGFWGIVREKQPNAVLFSDAGPDVRWVGNERGFAGETNWSTITREGIQIGKADTKLLNVGDSAGRDWMVAECDVSVRPGWFYHSKEDTMVKSVAELVDIYYKSVGRNGTLLLNVPPDRRGLFHETDVARLKAFGETIRATFANNFAANKPATASETRGEHPTYAANLITDGDPATYWAPEDGTTSGWVEIDLGQPTTFDRMMLREPVRLGQRINAFRVEAWDNGEWKPFANGTTVGYKRLLRFDPITTNKVRVVVERSLAVPLLSEIGLYQAAPGENGE